MLFSKSMFGYSSIARFIPEPIPRYGISFVAKVKITGFLATDTPALIFSMF